MSMAMEQAISAAGYELPKGGVVADGKMHRFATSASKQHSRDGWYVCHGDYGAFGSWRDSSTHSWVKDKGYTLTKADWDKIEAQKKAAWEDALRAADDAARRCKRVYDSASETGNSEYLTRKGIGVPDGVRFVKNLDAKALGFDKEGWLINGILVPVYNKDGVLRSLQVIPDESKRKFFIKDAQTSKGFHVLGGIDNADHIILAEGIATAQSVREATGLPVVVTFSSGNLERVARIIRSMHQRAQITIAADDDHAGRSAGNAAAVAVNGDIVVAPNGGDFNDLHIAQGIDAVRGYFAVKNENWRNDLIVIYKNDGTEKIPVRVHNLAAILRNGDEFIGRVRGNAMSGNVAYNGVDLNDAALIRIKTILEKNYFNGTEKVGTREVEEALSLVADELQFHPVKDYLYSLKWDGIGRINEFFHMFCGTADDEYHTGVARAFFIQAVSRVLEPGCKADLMLILESAQGLGKSSLFATLFGEWYSEVTASLNDKDFFQGLRGVWCSDFGELDQFAKADQTRVKQVLTMQADHYRPSYGRNVLKFQRQNVFVGGTNRDNWNKDDTGARRFLPVKVCCEINLKLLEFSRDQLWAEALELYKAKPDKWWFVAGATDQQNTRYDADSWESVINDWLTDYKLSIVQQRLTTAFILEDCFKIPTKDHTRQQQTRIGSIMPRLGYTKERSTENGIRVYFYSKAPA